MATKKETLNIRFSFDPIYGPALNHKGELQCDICFHDFFAPEIDIKILDFSVCPTCIQFGPKAVAAETELTSRREDRVRKFCGSDHPEDLKSMQALYLKLAKALRHLDSFYAIPGGAVAIAIAGVPVEIIRLGYHAKPGAKTTHHRRGIEYLLESMKEGAAPGKGA